MEPRVVRVVVGEADYDRVVGELWVLGPSAVAEDGRGDAVQLTAGYTSPQDAAATAARLTGHAPELIGPDEDSWIASWRTHVAPYRTGPWRVRLPEHSRPDDDAIDLVIEPGSAFGFSHVSTRLALELLAARLPPSADVGDVGSGTGILAVGSALLGANRVHAVDIDEVAVAMTAENAQRNQAGVEISLGSAAALPLPTYDFVMANMTAATLIDICDDLVEKIADQGHLVLSGFLETQRAEVLAAFWRFRPTAHLLEDEWCAVLLQTRSA